MVTTFPIKNSNFIQLISNLRNSGYDKFINYSLQITMTFTNIIRHLIEVFYPSLCAACDEPLVKNENLLCTRCRYELPRTNFHLQPENDITRIFWGRVRVEHATAYYFFQKGGHVQKLIHKLKYKGEKDLGFEIGKIIGRELNPTTFGEIDMIIPVPLHKSRKRKRGYNQSECIANGISATMSKPVNAGILFRQIANPTQTKKHRYERWENVEGIFFIKNPNLIHYKHILLVDDVITTGATLEACATALLQTEGVKVSIVALAKA
jgi:ComF family protein